MFWPSTIWQLSGVHCLAGYWISVDYFFIFFFIPVMPVPVFPAEVVVSLPDPGIECTTTR